MVWVKKLKYSYVFIFCKISQQNVFDVILKSQKVFLDYKKQKVKKVEKIRIFPKGLVHGFGKKIGNFYMFFNMFGKINQQNVFNVILESQKAFLDYKKQKVIKKIKKSGFFQRFWEKNLKFFHVFIFCKKQQAKCV